jgi:hypothetical protein
VTDERPDSSVEPQDYTVAFSPKQVAGFVLVAALVLAVLRRLRRARRPS